MIDDILLQDWQDYNTWKTPDVSCIDDDLREAMLNLWKHGVKTKNSCSGHGDIRGFYFSFYYNHMFVRYLRLNGVSPVGISGALWGVYGQECMDLLLAYRGNDYDLIRVCSVRGDDFLI